MTTALWVIDKFPLPPGSGSTGQLAMFEIAAVLPLWISAANGNQTLRGLPREWGHPWRGVYMPGNKLSGSRAALQESELLRALRNVAPSGHTFQPALYNWSFSTNRGWSRCLHQAPPLVSGGWGAESRDAVFICVLPAPPSILPEWEASVPGNATAEEAGDCSLLGLS